ncbi:hypothetical protein L1987_77125 [Smallanthus sonchifolius]|uniref:Uncharacterized protein n=1 Tax=Smallanthus sonchifolius TaxID=185202 RepID=A0ACB8ZA51_9ASTR|nr:hypothetical protein L1987_77125 [Smallanthus sonchifolius]
MNVEKLMKMTGAVRIGGKGSVRRKKKALHRTNDTLKRTGNVIPSVEGRKSLGSASRELDDDDEEEDIAGGHGAFVIMIYEEKFMEAMALSDDSDS